VTQIPPPANDPELPLAPPERPLLLNALVVRFAHIAPDATVESIKAMESPVSGEQLARIGASMVPGRVEIALTSGFGTVRTLSLTPAELIVLVTTAQKFVRELPR